MSPNQPKTTNERVIPAAIDEIAAREPSSVWAYYPKSDISYDDGFRKITYADIANAINGAAWWIKNTLGTSDALDTIAYIGPNDLKYPIFVNAAVKTGYQLLLSSPLNPTKAHVALFKTLNCKALITPTTDSTSAKSILESYEVRLLAPPTLDDLLQKQHPAFPYEKTWEEARNDPLVVLHTSGSTGLPKPIVLSHTFATTFANMSQLEPPPGYVNQTRYLHGKTIFSPLPFFHGVGVDFGLISTVFNRTTLVWALSGIPPSGSAVAAAVKQIKIDTAFLAAPLVEDIGKSESLSNEVVANLHNIAFTGGDLPAQIGDKLADKLHLFPIYGLTEIGHAPQIESKNHDWRDWKYLQWNEEAFGLDWQEVVPGLYEFCMQKRDNAEPYQTGFTVLHDIVEQRTKDLFTQHPEKPGLWQYSERADNIIVFLNGEKLNPSIVEGRVDSHPEVKSALVIGTQRYQAALLVELADADSREPRADIIGRLWPTIEKANADCPPYASISKSSIIFTRPERPMVRTPKGTVMRHKTLDVYSTEIEKFYASLSEESQGDAAGDLVLKNPTILQNPEELKSYLHKRICKVMDWNDLQRGDNFFASGMDSVRALQLLRNLRSLGDVNLGLIYQNPSVDSLALAIIEANDSSNTDTSGKRSKIVRTTLKTFENKLEALLPTMRSKEHGRTSKNINQAVLLTGSTGNVGRYILHSLLKDSRVAHVYCINRSGNADRNLVSNVDHQRVTFLTGNVSENPHFGLNDNTFDEVAARVTRVIHNAWTVDFNLALDSYLEQLTGIVNLVEFAAETKCHPTLTFLSSISSVQSYSQAVVPEEIVPEASAAGPTGYGQSKWIAENLLDIAAQRFGIDARILRVGQVAGPVDLEGVWNRQEWVPSLVVSSAALGKIPDLLPKFVNQVGEPKEVNWVPVDHLAAIITGLALTERTKQKESTSSSAYVRHISNPRTCSWSSLVPAITETIGPVNKIGCKNDSIDCVPYTSWLETLQDSAKTMDDKDIASIAKSIPAIKLLEFFEDLGVQSSIPTLATERTELDSKELRNLKAITPMDMQKWTQGWIRQDLAQS